MATVIWAELTSREIGEAGRGGALAVVPLGCTEQHADHLPVDTDTYQVGRLAREGAEVASGRGFRVLVVPVLPFGPTSEHYGYPGTIHVDSAVYLQVVKGIVHSVVDSGFWRVVVIHGCGGHWVVPGALWDVKAEAVRSGQRLVLRQFGVGDLWRPSRESLFPDDPGVDSAHAGVIETALCLSGREELVRMENHRPPTVANLERRYREQGEVFLFSEMSDTGALSDASAATVEIGSRMWSDTTSRLAALFVELARADGVDNPGQA